MKKHIALLLILGFVVSCKKSETSPDNVTVNNDDPDEALSGGKATNFDVSSRAFSLPAANLSSGSLQKHIAGDAVFGATFITPPATIQGGLGPIFNKTSCSSCHNQDGRGNSIFNSTTDHSFLLRLSLAGAGTYGEPLSVPGFGNQLQPSAVFGVQPEGAINATYNLINGSFADGETYSLLDPVYSISSPYITLPTGVLISPRAAPPNFGLGLLEAISETTILQNADPNDANGDGISGKANYVWDFTKNAKVIGRFGWKANQPDLYQQSAGAFSGDMGITSSVFPVESSDGQLQAVPSHSIEITDSQLSDITFYLQSLGVPARRNVKDASTKKGKGIFIAAKCSACHLTKIQTGDLVGLAEVSNQTIRPYTDLLLHDMGTGLADNRPDFDATGSEWRTPPLWGIGLTQVVNGHTNFLHDGRARNIMEAIMWHGGEANTSKEYVRNLSKTERSQLLLFLNSL